MDYTGERMVPEKADGRTFWEHIYRYQFALSFVSGKQVLDIACGEGYGTASLARAGAASVIGVDISEEACRHAREKYGIDARPGNAEQIPLPEQSRDVVVSFETIEHVPQPANLVAEIRRVLRPQGRFVISTPNEEVYSARQANPFHCSEMNLSEFRKLLATHFQTIQVYLQVPTCVPRWSVRNFSLENPVWRRFKPFDLFRQRVCRPFMVGALEQARANPHGEIARPEGWVSGWLNPYRVRRVGGYRASCPRYYIAVCR